MVVRAEQRKYSGDLVDVRAIEPEDHRFATVALGQHFLHRIRHSLHLSAAAENADENYFYLRISIQHRERGAITSCRRRARTAIEKTRRLPALLGDHLLTPLVVRLNRLKDFAQLVDAETPRCTYRVARWRRSGLDVDSATRRVHDDIAFCAPVHGDGQITLALDNEPRLDQQRFGHF